MLKLRAFFSCYFWVLLFGYYQFHRSALPEKTNLQNNVLFAEWLKFCWQLFCRQWH